MIAVAAIWLSSKRVFASGGQADCAKIQKSTNIGPWRSLASALAWGARGPGFKSRRPDQIPQRLTLRGLHYNHGLAPKFSPKWTPVANCYFLLPLRSHRVRPLHQLVELHRAV